MSDNLWEIPQDNAETITDITILKGQLGFLKISIENIEAKIVANDKRLFFRCECGKYHRLQDMILIRTHWEGGRDSSWREGEWQLYCEDSKIRNRLIFTDLSSLPYQRRQELKYSTEQQFKQRFRNAFKSAVDTYGDNEERAKFPGSRTYVSTSIQQNPEYFDLPTHESLKELLRKELVP